MFRYLIVLLAAAGIGCVSAPSTLAGALKPGIIGDARFSTDDNSTTERISFRTSAPAEQVRAEFEQYCIRLGMKQDARPIATGFGIEWFESDRESLGILLSVDSDGALAVTYLFNR